MEFLEALSAEVVQQARHSLERLCVENIRFDVVDEQGRPAVELPLWQQALDAVAPSGESGGGGGSAGSRSPASDAALDLVEQINQEALVVFRHVSEGDKAKGTLARLEYMRSSLHVMDSDNVVLVAGYARRWCDRIFEFLNPQRRTPLEHECPSCGYARMHAVNDEGESIKTACLSAIWEDGRVSRIECGYCLARWGRHQVWEVLTPCDTVRAVQELSGVAH